MNAGLITVNYWVKRPDSLFHSFYFVNQFYRFILINVKGKGKVPSASA
jgi:hypothetical protein